MQQTRMNTCCSARREYEGHGRDKTCEQQDAGAHLHKQRHAQVEVVWRGPSSLLILLLVGTGPVAVIQCSIFGSGYIKMQGEQD